MKNIVIIAFVILATSCQSKQKTWKITDFGAKTDTTTTNTVAIQNAIDACNKAGGGTVTIDGGTYISGTIILKNNVTLNVAKNSKLIASINPNDFITIDPFVDATGQQRGKCLIGAIDAENIGITGEGTIDGRGDMFTVKMVTETIKKLGITLEEISNVKENPLYEGGKVRKFDRPFLIRLVRTKGIKISDVQLTKPAAWTVHLFQCKNFQINNISIYSHVNQNNDGIDIDSSEDGTITNCKIDTGDDAVCFKATSPEPTQNILVRDCSLKSEWGTIKFGTESMGDFKNITVKNCYVHETRGGGIKILSADGANISNILIDSIRMENVDMPLFIRLGERLLTYRDAPVRPVGSINNVTISNITATTWGLDESRVSPPTGILITGTPNHKIGTIKLENIKIQLPGGGTKEHAAIVLPENEKVYPEFSKFGVVPAYGLYSRHIGNLETKNVQFSIDKTDERKEIINN